MDVNYKLYLVTDRRFLNGRSLKKVIEDSILGGVSLVQVREKTANTREFYSIASQIKEVTDYYNIPILINDRIDIAQAIDAHGVHLGQDDMPIKLARKILGQDKIIGISASNLNEALEAENQGADYVGIGSIFPTNSKKDVKNVLGLSKLEQIVSKISIPSVAIGGININNAKDVLNTKVDGISVISAILGEQNIKTAAQNLIK